MNKAYSRINWENYPSDSTPINENNLNKIDVAVDEIDNRVIEQDATKATKAEVSTLVRDISFEESTGIITITKKNNSVLKIDTKMEKIAVNFSYDSNTQQIILTLIDGTKQYIDLSALITQYEFIDTSTIGCQIVSDGKVKFTVLDGSITEEKLQPNYLADIKVETAKAQNSELNAENSATLSKSYTQGGTGAREGEDTNNAKYFYEQAKQISQGLNGIIPMGTVSFANLPTSGMEYGWMYNISDEFISDERFNDGGGVYYGAGNNAIWTSEDKWDVTASSGVTGVKGSKEIAYRQGNVNITPEDIGALKDDGNSKNNIVTFTANDYLAPTEWTDVEQINSGEKHSSLFNKISAMFKNVRYLYNMLGNTDISDIGDGTATGAIAAQNETLAQLNTNLSAVGTGFSVSKSTNTTMTIGNNIISFDVAVWNDNCFSNDTFWVQADGIYQFLFATDIVPQEATAIGIIFVVNDILTVQPVSESIVAHKSCNGTYSMKLTKGDRVQLCFYSNTNGTVLSHGATFQCLRLK